MEEWKSHFAHIMNEKIQREASVEHGYDGRWKVCVGRKAFIERR